MSQVDFYVVEGGDERAHDVFFCRLVSKAWRQGHVIYVQARDAEHASSFDDLLWTYHDISFVPHTREGDADFPQVVPIAVGSAARIPAGADLLVNLGGEPAAGFEQLKRIADTAGSDAAARERARARFRFYQERGLTVTTHRVTA
jgi:DNA polymerase-3 subunit chi